ncbi:MAG TPA: serine hydrolase domain-containing protein [Pyrinomonadaceae bacterium]|nr:serine hydrolase domain-containing protein [Pyrinomonadaceae bacterium]
MLFMKNARFAIALLWIFLCASMTVNGQINDKFAEFKIFYEKELKENGIVGSSFIFLKDNKTIAQDFYGSANLEKDQKIDENTIYHWASNTKPFTGIAIMQLRDRGLLTLDDSVTKYLPELEKVHNPFGKMSEITIRQLMNHSAGFRNSTFPYKKGKDWEPFEPTKYSQVEAMLPFTEILFKPGSKFSYSNLGIVFLGQIIERLTGDDYEVYVDKNILRPLEMHRSYFDSTPYHLLKYRSHSYYIENGKRTTGRFDADSGITVSNSGLNSPLTDMTKYLNFLIGDSEKKGVYEGILKRSSLEEMFRQTISAPFDANGNAGFTTAVGLNFFIDERNGETFLGHGGDQNGFISYIEFNLKKRTASILVFNTNILLPENTPLEKDMVGKLRKAVRKLHESF